MSEVSLPRRALPEPGPGANPLRAGLMEFLNSMLTDRSALLDFGTPVGMATLPANRMRGVARPVVEEATEGVANAANRMRRAATKENPLGEVLEGVARRPEYGGAEAKSVKAMRKEAGRQGPVSPTEVSPFEIRQLTGGGVFSGGGAPWNVGLETAEDVARKRTRQRMPTLEDVLYGLKKRGYYDW